MNENLWNIPQAVVRLNRDPYIDQMGKSTQKLVRKSARLMQMASKPKEKMTPKANSTSTKQAVERKSSVKHSPKRRKSTKLSRSPITKSHVEHVPIIPIIKSALRNRSKSVTFDLPPIILQSSSNSKEGVSNKPNNRLRSRSNSVSYTSPKRSHVNSIGRTLFKPNTTPFRSPFGIGTNVIAESGISTQSLSDGDIPIDLTTSNAIAGRCISTQSLSDSDMPIDLTTSNVTQNLSFFHPSTAINGANGSSIYANNISSEVASYIDISTSQTTSKVAENVSFVHDTTAIDGANGSSIHANNISNEVASYIDISTSQTHAASDASDFGQILQYQNRIDGLILSHQVKIIKIKALNVERNALLAQIEGLHRINRSLTETVDMFRFNDENVRPLNQNHMAIETQRQANQLKNEVGVLQARIERLNQQNYGLQEENKKLKECLSTHADKILSERNYNM